MITCVTDLTGTSVPVTNDTSVTEPTGSVICLRDKAKLKSYGISNEWRKSRTTMEGGSLVKYRTKLYIVPSVEPSIPTLSLSLSSFYSCWRLGECILPEDGLKCSWFSFLSFFMKFARSVLMVLQVVKSCPKCPANSKTLDLIANLKKKVNIY